MEFWFKEYISDLVVNIEGYNIMWKDCFLFDYGGVCVYIKEDIKYEFVEILICCIDYEIIWVKLMFLRFFCGFLCVILVVVYYFGWISLVEFDG